MQSATLTYILHCNACGVHGEIDEFTETFTCPQCQGEMRLFEVRISGDDSLIEALLEQLIDSAERGDVISKRTLAFLLDSPNEHTRATVENALYRKKYPEYNIKHRQNNNAKTFNPLKIKSPSSSQQARQISGLTQNRKTINATNLPRRTNQIEMSQDRNRSNARSPSKVNVLLPHHAFLKTQILNNNKEEKMKNTISVELDSDYKISGNITAVLRENDRGKHVVILTDIHCPEWDFSTCAKEACSMIKISIYDEDNDLCTSEAKRLSDFWRNGASISISDDMRPARVVVLIAKTYRHV